MPEQNVLGGNGGIGFEFEHPMPIGLLVAMQRLRRRGDAAVEFGFFNDGLSGGVEHLDLVVQ